jgi:uncharacterized protein involved in exopolysaccharide biosynthesis
MLRTTTGATFARPSGNREGFLRFGATWSFSMSSSPAASLTPRRFVGLLLSQRRLWLIPTVAGAAIAAAYSLVAPRYWEASQALVVRQETAGSASPRPGKFTDLYEMRTLQETILELAKSQQVVVAALQEVDRRRTGSEPAAPTAAKIEQFRKRLKMVPPDGSEFGKTEVFYFCVRDSNRDRAIDLVSELCSQLDVALRDLRAKRADSLIGELEKQVDVAAEQLAQETKRLVDFESQVGADLGELRMLHSASSGQSDMRQEMVAVETDVRKFKTELGEVEQLLALLNAAERDPQALIATPNSLLVSQPALRRLKDGLVDAQLKTAQLAGTRATDHPLVLAAVESEAQIRNDLHRELVTAIKGAEVDLNLGRQRLAAAQQRLDNLQSRLGRLAHERGEYSNRVAAVDNSRVSLDRARADLSTAKAALAAAHSGSLVTRLDAPETGPYPVGPSRKVISAAGAAAGLILGLGLVFLGLGPQNDRRQGGDRRAVPRPAGVPSAPAEVVRRSAPISAPAPSEPVAPAATIVEPAPQAPPRGKPIFTVAPQWDDSWFASAGVTAAPAKDAEPAAASKASAPPPASMAPAVPIGLPVTPMEPVAGYSGMTLQEALAAARRLQP